MDHRGSGPDLFHSHHGLHGAHATGSEVDEYFSNLTTAIFIFSFSVFFHRRDFWISGLVDF